MADDGRLEGSIEVPLHSSAVPVQAVRLRLPLDPVMVEPVEPASGPSPEGPHG